MKSGGDGTGMIQGVRFGVGGGPSFDDDDRSASWHGSFFEGVTLAVGDRIPDEDVGYKQVAVPLNLVAERVANGLWAYGADASLRLDLSALRLNVDAGARVSLLTSQGEQGLGVTPFARLGFGQDCLGVEAGALAYSGHGDVRAGHSYYISYLNLGALAQILGYL